MNMLLMIGSVSLLIATMMTSSTEGVICRDAYFACAPYRLFCHIPNVRDKCKLTCQVCQPDQCAVNNGGCAHLCRWTGTRTQCGCLPGFRLAGDNQTCQDINECTEGANPCPTGTPLHCVNTVGSYSCQANTCSQTPGKLNYYRDSRCCTLRNGTCGQTATIQAALSARNAAPVQRVLGGRPSAYSAWPWQVQITHQGFHHCGASLIANQWLLGAAHCFNDEDYSYTNMLAHLGQVRGAHVTFPEHSMTEQRAIIQVIIHPASSGYVDDIALVKLATPVTYSDVIQPICLPCGEEPAVGVKCWATGFGRTENSGRDPSSILREADVPIVGHQTCSNVFQQYHHIDADKMKCAGYPNGQIDTCTGDSGGPLACQRLDSCEWYISGITSFGKGCGVAGFYGVYTNVANYEAWIRQTLGSNVTGMCDNSPCQGMEDVDDDCETKMDNCTAFPQYMQTNCRRTCCRLTNNEISNCRDNREEMCRTMAHQCNSATFSALLRTHCRKTCKVCS